MRVKVILAVALLLQFALPSNAIFFKAIEYLTSGRGNLRNRNLAAGGESADNHISASSTYTGSEETHVGSFGFTSASEGDLGPGQLDLLLFISGPQNMQTDDFVDETLYFSNTKIDTSSCQDGTRHTTVSGAFANTPASNTRANLVAQKAECTIGGKALTAYCQNFDSGSRLDADPIDYCDLEDVSDIVNSVLCVSTVAQSNTAEGKRWGTTTDSQGNNDNPFDYDLCTMGTFSSDSIVTNNEFNLQQFQIENYDILDQQCFTDSNSNKEEFDDIVCEESNHQKTATSENQQVTLGFSAITDLLNSRVSYDNSDHRYPYQEYCIPEEEDTLLTELFGCADDQRVPCTDSDKPADGRQCAGGLDDGPVYHTRWEKNSKHNMFEDETYSGLDNYRKNKYGSSTDEHVCSDAEIVVANELSAYLDKQDRDITRACRNAIDAFQDASRTYVEFTTPASESSADLYSVLREAWRQAEFTLRSVKMQEQVRDRMLKYRDWTLYRFSSLEQSPSDAFNDRTEANMIAEQVDNPSRSITLVGTGGAGSVAYQDFRNAWDNHIMQYEVLSANEISALKNDLDDALQQVANAKSHAQQLANTQQAASAAVATVSVHFRKKLNLWMRLETMLEDAFKTALASTDTHFGGANRNHMDANFAMSKQHEPKGFTYTNNREAKIENGEDYHNNRNSLNFDGDFASQEPDYDNHEHEFTASNGPIETSYPCNNNADCSGFTFDSSTHPQHHRTATCVNDYCLISASVLHDEGDAKTTFSTHITDPQTEFANSKTKDLSDPHGGTTNDGAYAYSFGDRTTTTINPISSGGRD